MVYTQEAIRDLGLGQLSRDEVNVGVQALNGLTTLLGKDWVSTLGWSGSRSPIIVRSAIKVWDDWNAIKGYRGAKKLEAKWRTAAGRADLQSLEFEVLVAARLAPLATNVELYPPIGAGELDLGIQMEKRMIYVEASVRALSETMRRTNEALTRLSAAVANARPGHHNYLGIAALIEDFNLTALEEWISRCKELSNAHFENIAMFRSRGIMEHPENDPDAREFVGKPSLFTVSLQATGGVVTHKGTVCIQVDDPYAVSKLEEEAGQLPKSAPGIIVLDVSAVIQQFEDCADAIAARMNNPNVHTRVSAVVLAGLLNDVNGRKLDKVRILNNKNARHPLSEKEQSVLASAFAPSAGS